MNTWISDWRPEDETFWNSTGKVVARRNLIWSIVAEHLGFSIWLIWSIVVTKLNSVGFHFTTDQLFQLVALPGLIGSLMRFPYTFAVTTFGGRNWTIFSPLGTAKASPPRTAARALCPHPIDRRPLCPTSNGPSSSTQAACGDQWHTMTRTGRLPRLMAHQREPMLDIHPADASQWQLSDGGLVRLESPHGATMLPVRLHRPAPRRSVRADALDRSVFIGWSDRQHRRSGNGPDIGPA